MLDRAGQQFGNYRLVRPLGHGGFADVYLGQHVYLGTNAAIKLMQTRLDQNNLQRFLAEARIIANFTHPHIVRVLEFGVEDVHSTPFLVMDYAPRGTLRQLYAANTSVPLSRVVDYVEQIAAALQYAHSKNIIHRDVKPENMLLGEQGNVLLADFGIAVIAQTSRYRAPQEVGGTAVYMAPEQLQGRAVASSDQYALGIVVYEWLSGAPPFEGSFTEILAQHMTVAPQRLGTRVSGLPQSIEEVVHKALAKEPQWRFATIEEFARALKMASYSQSSTLPGQNASTFINNTPLLSSTQVQSTFVRPAQPASGYPSGTMATTPASSIIRAIEPASSGVRPAMLPSPFADSISTPPFGGIETIRARPLIGNKTRRNMGILVGCILLVVLLIGALVLGTKLGSGSSSLTSTGVASSTANAGGASGSKHGTGSSVTPTPTAIPSGTVLYQTSDFTDHWVSAPEWKPIDGTMGSDGSSGSDGSKSTGFITWAPEQMPVANYEVSAQIEFVRSTYNMDPDLWGNNYEFGIMIRGDGNNNGYEVGMISLKDYLAEQSQDTGAQGAIVGLVQNDNTSSDYFVDGLSMGTSQLKVRDYQLDDQWHTYRVDVVGNDMKLYLDDTLLLETTDNTYLSPGYVGLRSVYADVNVKSFKIISL